MTRVSLGLLALIAATACGQTERKTASMTTGSGGEDGSGGEGGGGSGGSSSSGGDAGGVVSTGGSSPTPSAVAECQKYCEMPSNRLPQALCEDWNRRGWEPPFCQLDPAAPCADYCSQVYETVSPACGAALQAVIPCVAPYYAKGVITPSCWLADCRYLLFTMTSACYGLQEKLAAARATWQASGVVEYDLAYDQQDGMKAHVAVRANKEPEVTPTGAFAWTVPKLFDNVEYYLHQPGVAPDVNYDTDLGYVLNVVVRHGCDETFGRVSGIQVAPLR